MNAVRINIAALVSRITLGTVLIAHGLLKFFVFTLPGAASFFVSVGFPGWAAYIVTPFEVLGGIALVIGYRTSWVALAALVELLGIVSVHYANGWLFTNKNGGWEYPIVLVMLAVTVALLGEGAYSLRRRQQEAPAAGYSTP